MALVLQILMIACASFALCLAPAQASASLSDLQKPENSTAILTYWDAASSASCLGILNVPRIGAEKDRNGKPFKHNAASRGYRHGDPGTKLAFELVGFLKDGERLPADPYIWIPVDRRTAFWDEGLYLVPLRKIEEDVSAEGGAVRMRKLRYELLQGAHKGTQRWMPQGAKMLRKKTFRRTLQRQKLTQSFRRYQNLTGLRLTGRCL